MELGGVGGEEQPNFFHGKLCQHKFGRHGDQPASWPIKAPSSTRIFWVVHGPVSS